MTEAMTEEAVFELLSLVCRVDGDGALRYYDASGLLHRVHGPAVKYVDGSLAWFRNGQLHRLDGPAIAYADGFRAWYIKGKSLTEAAWQKAVASMENV